MAVLDELKADPEAVKELGNEIFSDLARKLPAELRNGTPAPNPDNPDWLTEILEASRPLLLHRLRGGSGPGVRSAASAEKNPPRPPFTKGERDDGQPSGRSSAKTGGAP
jgi:hypothetical protein